MKMLDLEQRTRKWVRGDTSVLPLESVDYLIVHHTSRNIDHPKLVRARHILKNGWEDSGYHYFIGNGIITEDGMVYKGRDEKYQGAHAEEYNPQSLGINLIGNFEKSKPTEKQINTLIDLLVQKAGQYDIPAKRILGHNEVADTLCPGKNINMDYIREQVAERLTKRNIG